MLLNVTVQHALLLVEHALLLSNLVVIIDTVNVTIVSFLWLPSNLFPLQLSDAPKTYLFLHLQTRFLLKK
jgi:hypothetical protein